MKVTKHNHQPINIKSVTWTRDSHGLFDQESKQVIKKSIKTNQEGALVRLKTEEVQLIPRQSQQQNKDKDNQTLLGYLSQENDNYKFCTVNYYLNEICDENDEVEQNSTDQNIFETQFSTCAEHYDMENYQNNNDQLIYKNLKKYDNNYQKAWIVVRSLKIGKNQGGYKLNIGDLFKLGRVKFRIRDIKFSEKISYENDDEYTKYLDAQSKDKSFQAQDDLNKDQFLSEISSVIKIVNTKSSLTYSMINNEYVGELPCRICLSEYFSNTNPLISVCKCKGTVKYIHLDCIKNWIKSRLNVRLSPTGMTSSYQWKNFDCEICKASYPQSIMLNNKKTELIEIPQPKYDNYIILEALCSEKRNTVSIHMVDIKDLTGIKESIKLGRGHDSDIRISDISISRTHAIIKFKNDGFQMEDNMSKFGTLLLVHKPLDLTTFNNIALQIGRTVMSFNIKRYFDKNTKNNEQNNNIDNNICKLNFCI